MPIHRQGDLGLKKIFKSSNFSDKIALTIALWFGMGAFPGIPGTIGSIGAVPLYMLMSLFEAEYQVIFFCIISMLAVWSSGRAEQLIGRNDPGLIVVDEVSGFLLTVLFIPLTFFNILAGLFLFRLFDIIKPYPIKTIEKLRGGFGIVFDDLLAGFYAHLSLLLILYLLK
jgi:phosphatidylglycerophosphatase A